MYHVCSLCIYTTIPAITDRSNALLQNGCKMKVDNGISYMCTYVSNVLVRFGSIMVVGGAGSNGFGSTVPSVLQYCSCDSVPAGLPVRAAPVPMV